MTGPHSIPEDDRHDMRREGAECARDEYIAGMVRDILQGGLVCGCETLAEYVACFQYENPEAYAALKRFIREGVEEAA